MLLKNLIFNFPGKLIIYTAELVQPNMLPICNCSASESHTL